MGVVRLKPLTLNLYQTLLLLTQSHLLRRWFVYFFTPMVFLG